MKKILIRDKYLDIIKQYKDIDLIKVITGVRRSGKSTLLNQFKEYLIDSGVREGNIVYINFESFEWTIIGNHEDLYRFVVSKYQKEKLYIFLDEIQNIEHWEKAVNALFVDLDCDIYVTGSNAYLLSSELTTLIAGRIATIRVYPFSFSEYISVYPFTEETIDEKLNEYMLYGGLPMLVNMGRKKNLIENYLNDIKDVVLKRDVIERNKIRDVRLLENLLRYLSSTIGLLVTANSIAVYLTKNGYPTDNQTVDAYLNMLESAYIVYKTPRYNVQGKQLLKTQGKYYFVDLGLRNILNGFSQNTSGSAYENLVYLELLGRGYDVHTGKLDEIEIDFIAKKADETIYIQVSRSILDENIEKRERKSLLAIEDNYPKTILTMDKTRRKTDDGIVVVNIIDFLLGI